MANNLFLFQCYGLQCDVSCGGGKQLRTAKCVDQSNNTVTHNSNCIHGDKASLTRMCNTQHCPKWHAGAWAETVSEKINYYSYQNCFGKF